MRFHFLAHSNSSFKNTLYIYDLLLLKNLQFLIRYPQQTTLRLFGECAAISDAKHQHNRRYIGWSSWSSPLQMFQLVHSMFYIPTLNYQYNRSHHINSRSDSVSKVLIYNIKVINDTPKFAQLKNVVYYVTENNYSQE